MNRLSPLIVRRAGPLAPVFALGEILEDRDRLPGWVEDVKLFALGWLGGLVFFGTFLS
ncbi:MAG TPA: hypothetical protein VJR87_01850 [Allosphingosinicella sp.]|nr:hypothetical protein [Allosphingosinicella sp.]